ncbi:hypothetical protein EAG_09906 [Camponotus floridanus]|uniref:Uncharacterized protein n=1 Tax=Camponotus floridanus TaxID=104421 RepID=E2A6D1_CAMFO|nr:hypothetical protein EAG_09906 [Camponotus floridanus]
MKKKALVLGFTSVTHILATQRKMYTVFNKYSILVKNIKLKQKFGLLTARIDVKRARNRCVDPSRMLQEVFGPTMSLPGPIVRSLGRDTTPDEYSVDTLCHRLVNASRGRHREKTQITTAPVTEKDFRALVPQDSYIVVNKLNEGNEAVVPEGWPLTLGGSGLILHLGELEASALRLGECYLCVRSVAAATATATTSSVNGVKTAGKTAEQNTVEYQEFFDVNCANYLLTSKIGKMQRAKNKVIYCCSQIAVVWRTTSMRAPGILGWDREDEFMDWRELTNKGQPSSSAGTTSANLGGAQSSGVMKATSRPRRRSREDARPRTRETSSAEHRREEARSIDRLEHQSCRENRTIGKSGHTNTVMKSKSASSVDAWKEDLDGELDRGSSRRAHSKNSSSPTGDESRVKVKRCANVVSSTVMEKWKESSRCETRSRSIAPKDLKSPLQFEESILWQNNGANDSPKDLEDRLRNVGGPGDVSDEDLPAYIGSLLVTVERKIERVSLDDMTFPCPACRNIDTDDPLLGCRCAGDDEDNCDCPSSLLVSRKEQSAKSFEVAGIKHIDSDDEEEVRMGFVRGFLSPSTHAAKANRKYRGPLRTITTESRVRYGLQLAAPSLIIIFCLLLLNSRIINCQNASWIVEREVVAINHNADSDQIAITHDIVKSGSAAAGRSFDPTIRKLDDTNRIRFRVNDSASNASGLATFSR